MKIAYVCHWNPFVEDGVVRKIRSQTRAWRQFGAEVETFCLSSEPDNGRTPVLEGRHFLYGNPVAGRARATIKLARAAGRWRPDVVYLRYSLFFPPPVQLMRAVPTVVEINSDDRAEYLNRSRALGLYNAFNRRVLLSQARGVACVTSELAERVTRGATSLQRAQISNGISLDEGEPLPPARNARPRLVFLAGAADPWHGLDKIVWLASAVPEFDFDVIGVQGRLQQPTPPNVRIHPFGERPEYESILAASDVALGTLALHRKDMSEAAPLKVREYLLRGIPVVIGYDDPDLGDNPWFVLQLPNTETNVREAVRDIRDFVLSVAGRRVAREEVSDRIDILAKERERLAFLEAVASSASGRH